MAILLIFDNEKIQYGILRVNGIVSISEISVNVYKFCKRGSPISDTLFY